MSGDTLYLAGVIFCLHGQETGEFGAMIIGGVFLVLAFVKWTWGDK